MPEKKCSRFIEKKKKITYEARVCRSRTECQDKNVPEVALVTQKRTLGTFSRVYTVHVG